MIERTFASRRDKNADAVNRTEGQMKKALIVLFLLTAPTITARAQSSLPECPATQTENYVNCQFVYVSKSKREFIIEFKDPSRPGYGSGLSKDSKRGDIEINGIWKNRVRSGHGSTTHFHTVYRVQPLTPVLSSSGLVGELKDDEFDGRVTFFSEDGYSEEQLWSNGHFIRSLNGLPECPSKQKENYINCYFLYISPMFPENGHFIVEFRNPQHPGFGVAENNSGRWMDGLWRNGDLNGPGRLVVNKEPSKTYIGEFKDGKFNGQGTLSFRDAGGYNAQYVGEFKDGKANGQGTESVPDRGQKYVGEWRDDKKNGHGTYTSRESTYVGEFKDDNFHGQGTYTSLSGEKYVGEFKDGKYNGKGTLRSRDRKIYVGEFKDGQYLGPAKSELPECPASQIKSYINCHFIYASESKQEYVIEFKDPARPGFGVGQSKDGVNIEGIWENHATNGQGTVTYPDGNKYVGEFKDGKYNGHGTYMNPSRFKYVGEWKDGKFNGQGTYTFPSRQSRKKYENDALDKLMGAAEDEKRNGQATSTFPDGPKYVGEWKDNKPDGQGTFTFPDDNTQGEYDVPSFQNPGSKPTNYAEGTMYVGQWKDNILIGPGTITWDNGDVFNGEWKGNTITGTKAWKDGRKHTGEFDNSGNPKEPFAHNSTGSNSASTWSWIQQDQLSCNTKTVKETFFTILSEQFKAIQKSPGRSDQPPLSFLAWGALFGFDGVQVYLLTESSQPEMKKQILKEVRNTFPTLSLENTRSDGLDSAIKKLECSADLIGNFGPLGVYKTTATYSVQLTDDGRVYVTRH